MKVEIAGSGVVELGTTETNPTIGIVDYSRRETDDFGVTTVVERGFARTMSVRLGVPFLEVDALQRQLAELRATSAKWIADDRLGSLAFDGFYKSFDLDLALPPLSYCTLTVEGLAETTAVVDAGGDPAVDGASTLQLLQPVVVTDAMLVGCSVAENDWPEWSAATNYPVGAQVIRAATHRVYESVTAGNIGHDPAAQEGQWIDVGPTNRWAMFDQALGTATEASSSIAVTLRPGAITGLALLDVAADSVRVQAPGYDRTQVVVPGQAVTFLDLAIAAGADFTVTIARGGVVTPAVWNDAGTWSDAGTWNDTATSAGGSGAVAVGSLLVGKLVSLGSTEASPTAGIIDYSRKEVDEFGVATIVPRSWAKRMAAKALIRTDAVDAVAARITTVRAQPALWIGQDGLDSLTVYGFFKEFSIEVGETTSKLSLSIEGLSKAQRRARAAAVLVPRGLYDAATSYGEGDVVQYQGSSWYYTAQAATIGNAPPALPTTENSWWRVLAMAGAAGAPGTPGTPGTNGLNGTNGINGANGQSVHIAYADNATGTANFTTGDAGGRAFIGVYTDANPGADSNDPAAYGWTRLRGLDGINGVSGPGGWVHFAYANSANGTLDFDLSDPTGRAYLGVYTDQVEADSTNPASYTWSRIRGLDGTNGLNGTNGAPGAPGANGQPAFVHVAYADAPDGSANFTTGAPGARKFIGIHTSPVEADPTAYGDYVWSKLTGDNGLNGAAGTAGPPGANGQPSYVHFAYANSANGTLDFDVADPTGRRYLGVYSDATVADSLNPAAYTWSLVKGADGANGVNGTNGAPGAPGANGASSFVHVAYADSADGATSFTTGAPAARRWIGIHTGPVEADPTDYTAYTWSRLTGDNGLNGANGTPGAPGANGQPSYVHFAYANSANGVTDFHVSDPVGRRYIGIYTDQTIADSANPASYTWSLVKGEDGVSPPIITLTATPLIIRYDKDGAVYPNQNVTFTAVRQNTAATPVWTMRREDGVEIYSNTAAGYVAAAPSSWSSTGPDNLTQVTSDVAYLIGLGGGNGYVMEVSAGGATSRVTVKRVQDGSAGAPGAPGATPSPAYPAVSITARGYTSYPSVIPLPAGSTLTFTTNVHVFNPPFSGGEPTPGNLTIQGQYSTNGGASWNVIGSTYSGPIGNNTERDVGSAGGYTNASGVQQTVALRVFIATGGDGGNSLDLSVGYGQPS